MAAGIEPVGFLAAGLYADALHIEQVQVERERQGRGLGVGLLNAAVQEALARRLRMVTLTTFRSIPWNGPFYARHGFVETTCSLPPYLQQILDHERDLGWPDRCAMMRLL